MNEETIRNFLAWLDQATDEEIQTRKKSLLKEPGYRWDNAYQHWMLKTA